MRPCRMIPRFSLRTLVVFLLLVTSAMGLGRELHLGEWREEHIFDQPTASPGLLSFSPDGRRLLAAGYPARVWDLESGKTLFELKDPCGTITSGGFSPDGDWIATAVCQSSTATRPMEGGGDMVVEGDAVRIWDGHTGRLLEELSGDNTTFVSISPDGKSLLASSEFSVKVWRTDTWELLLQKEGLNPGLWLADSEHFSASKRGIGTYLIDLQGSAKGTCPFRYGEQLRASFVSPDGRYVVSYTENDVLGIRDVRSQEIITEFRGKREAPRLVFAPDGKHAFVVCNGNLSRLELETGRAERVRSFTWVRRACLSPDGRRLLISGSEGRGKYRSEMLDAGSLRRIAAMPSSGIFSPDGTRLANSWLYSVSVFRRAYPEWWWGVFYLWEFWLTVALAGVFAWSVWRDRKFLRRSAAAIIAGEAQA